MADTQTAPRAMKPITGFKKKLMDIVKEQEDLVIASYRRQGISRRRLRLSGRLGVERPKAERAIGRKLIVSDGYAEQLFQSLCDERFLRPTERGLFTLSEEAIEAIARALQRRGYVREAIRRLLRRELAKRGFTRSLGEHRPPRRTRAIPPIIGYFK